MSEIQNGYNTIDLLGFSVFADSLKSLDFKEKTIISTINAYSFVVTKDDDVFKDSLINSDILVPDGFPIVIAARWLNRCKISKIAGDDVFAFLMIRANELKHKVFFLGASNETIQKIINKVKREFPNINVKGYSPPFKDHFLDSDNKEMLDEINEFEPSVLFVGMTAPKQEKWVYQHRDKIKADVIASIGAVFDFYAGTNKRPAPIWVKLRLEWLVRLLKNPKRLWRRYLVDSPKFFRYLIMEKFNRFGNK